MKRFILLLSLSLVIVSCISFIPTKSTHAAGLTAHMAATSACESNPSDANCDNQDPDATGCAYDEAGPVATVDLSVQQIVSWINLVTGSNTTVATIVLRYSGGCESNWTHGYGSTGNKDVNGDYWDFYIDAVRITRDDGLSYTYSLPTRTYTDGWTNMIYSPIKKDQACIQVDEAEYTPNGDFVQGGGPGSYWYCTAFY